MTEENGGLKIDKRYLIKAIAKVIEWSKWTWKELTEEIPFLSLLLILDEISHEYSDDEPGYESFEGLQQQGYEIQEVGQISDITTMLKPLGIQVIGQ